MTWAETLNHTSAIGLRKPYHPYKNKAVSPGLPLQPAGYKYECESHMPLKQPQNKCTGTDRNAKPMENNDTSPYATTDTGQHNSKAGEKM